MAARHAGRGDVRAGEARVWRNSPTWPWEMVGRHTYLLQAEVVHRVVPAARRGVAGRGVVVGKEAWCSRSRRTGGRGVAERSVVVGGEARCSRRRRTAGRGRGVAVGGQRGAVAADGR